MIGFRHKPSDSMDAKAPGRGLAGALRRASRRLELRSVGLVPEHFSGIEGFRAAVAVVVPLAIAVACHSAALSWAVFAAFWVCLCDSPAPDPLRRKILAAFVIFGTLIAFSGSWIASATPTAGMAMGPVFVFLIIFLSSASSATGLLGTLLAVVAVVAVGFPADLGKATVQGAAFLGGGCWAYLLINWLWHRRPEMPLHHATDAVIVRLIDMTDSLIATGDGTHQDAQWHSDHAEHRRAVRLAIERLGGVLANYQSEAEATRAPFLRQRRAVEMAFNALIALDHAFISRLGSPADRIASARAFRSALLAWRAGRADFQQGRPDDEVWNHAIEDLHRVRRDLNGPVMVGCLIALEEATALMHQAPQDAVEDEPAKASASSEKTTIAALWVLLKDTRRWPHFQAKAALRQTAGVVWVYFAAMVFGLGYPYWASMAVIVVLQSAARITWTRGLERILGSLLGGVIALLLLSGTNDATVLSVASVVLAAVAISLRTVNYTIFVIFLTMLFIIVTEMLQPGTGISEARVLDNIIGSIVALAAVFSIWPDSEPSLQTRLENGFAANRAFLEAVQANVSLSDIQKAQRAAGLASIDAEVALHSFAGLPRPWRRKLSDADASQLKDLRAMAGEAAVAWHRHLAARSGQTPIVSPDLS